MTYVRLSEDGRAAYPSRDPERVGRIIAGGAVSVSVEWAGARAVERVWRGFLVELAPEEVPARPAPAGGGEPARIAAATRTHRGGTPAWARGLFGEALRAAIRERLAAFEPRRPGRPRRILA